MTEPPSRAVKGMNDILPPDSARWEWFEDTVRALMRRYGYRNIRTPIVEPTRAVRARPGRSHRHRREGDVLLRRRDERRPADAAPRGHRRHRARGDRARLLYDGGKRLYYIGPMFRHERPQKGRYRQFHQVGVEALGYAGPDVDAELILMCRALWRDLGLLKARRAARAQQPGPARRALRAPRTR